MPALRPPRMSEVRLSPTMRADAGSKSGTAAKAAAKKAGLGLSAPSSSEMKMFLKYGPIPALFSLDRWTAAAPLEARYRSYRGASSASSSGAPGTNQWPSARRL